ncbi:MAG: hypothetical protein AAFR65_09045 [Pseudomonadota bacterium]
MKKLLASAAACLGVMAMAGAAQASEVTFTFENPGADMPTGNFTTGGKCNGIKISSIDLCSIDENLGLTYTKDGIDLTAKAFNSGGITDLMVDLAPHTSGLAIVSPGEGSSDDQVQYSAGESILFEFGTEVSLEAMDFNAGADRECANPGGEGPCGTFDLFVNGSLFGSYTAIDDMVFDSIIGNSFEFVATDPNGGFAIASITVAETPIPGAAALLLSGLAGIGFNSSRRRRSA